MVVCIRCLCWLCFFFNDTATTEIYTYRHTLSLHDALPIWQRSHCVSKGPHVAGTADARGTRTGRAGIGLGFAASVAERSRGRGDVGVRESPRDREIGRAHV